MKDTNPQTVSAADMRQLANLERAATQDAIRPTDVVSVRKSIYPVKAGERGIALYVLGLQSRPCWNVMFKSGETAVVLAANLIRVAASLGE